MSELKPSTRIAEIATEFRGRGCDYRNTEVGAIIAYLDEQHAQREAISSPSDDNAAPRLTRHEFNDSLVEELDATKASLEAEREAHRQTQAKLDAVRSRMGRPGLGIPLSEFDDLGPCANCEHPQYQHKGGRSHCAEVSKGSRCECGAFRATAVSL